MAFDFSWDGALRIFALFLLSGLLLYALITTPPHSNEKVEAGFLLLPVGGALAVGLDWLSHATALQRYSHGLSLLSAHVLFAVVAQFLLACGELSRTLLGKWVWVYLALGTLALLGGAALGVDRAALAIVWKVITCITMLAVVLALMWRIRLLVSPSASLVAVAVAGMWALSLAVEGLGLRSGQTAGLQMVDALYFVFLVALGWVLSGRVYWLQLHRAQAHAPTMRPSFAPETGFSGVVETQAAQESVVLAVEQERSRIAQDIHDGVGSQLVGLIASLDPTSLQNKRILMGLENCLMDLKMTVDRMNHADSNIFDTLGRLRYRLQPSFDRAGIKVLWRVDVAGELLGIQMSEVSHLEHIVQECFSNILQHSQATKIKLVCRYEAELEPRLRLEVQDNGVGISQRDQAQFVGNGMANMLRRAQQLGVALHIGTQAGVGTRVRLYLPVRSASAIAQA